MDTSFGCSDFWDRLGEQALVMIGRWYSRQPLTNHNQRLSTQMIPEIVAPKACTSSLIVSGMGNYPTLMGWDRGHFSKLSAFLVNKRGYDYRVIPLNDALVMTWGQLRISCTCVFKVFPNDRVENFLKLQPHGLFMSHTSQTGAGRKIRCGTKKDLHSAQRSCEVKWRATGKRESLQLISNCKAQKNSCVKPEHC